ncbi:CmpA/NrtA family ABC transporter substrate-binding protein [Bacterioplanoides sp.]|uniref:CmpA/NrtA family ABC transporter substrate-binding protein n=2 Tax=Bacterioplanoides sp. TaxID=2066072 RepID=UPI003BA8757B
MTTPQQTTRQASALEKDKLTLGYMPLTDALPLIAAQEMGYFRHAGLNVTLQQEVSWANIRDKVIVGHFDAAQMLAPMLLATHLGIGCLRKPMQAPMSLALNGNALTVSNTLAETLAVDNIASASAQQLGQQLATLIQQRQQNEQEKLVFAVVFPFSIHNLLMRAWLADAGIDPDKDIELLVLPPSQMVDHLKLQHIDGFFAGAPWNSVAIQQGVGQCLMPATKLWQQAPDKVLGVTQEWAQQHPNTLQALIHAISQGAQWCHEHPEKAAELLAEALEQPTEALLPALTGEFRYKLGDSPVSIHNMLVLDPLQAGEAKVEHGEWFLQQMQRWGWIQADTNIKHVAQECFSSH